MTETVLVVNAGSSSITFQLFSVVAGDQLERRRPYRRHARMIDISTLPFLKGKKALVAGIANDQSIGYGCAKAFRAFGAAQQLSGRFEMQGGSGTTCRVVVPEWKRPQDTLEVTH